MSYQQTKTKVSSAFAKIGNHNGTSQPISLDNRASIVHELFIADMLASMATKRKDEAKKAAMEAGILGDNYVEGNTTEVYTNEHLTISAKTATAAERLDGIVLQNELIKLIGAEKALPLIKKCKTKSKPATSYIFAVK